MKNQAIKYLKSVLALGFLWCVFPAFAQNNELSTREPVDSQNELLSTVSNIVVGVTDTTVLSHPTWLYGLLAIFGMVLLYGALNTVLQKAVKDETLINLMLNMRIRAVVLSLMAAFAVGVGAMTLMEIHANEERTQEFTQQHIESARTSGLAALYNWLGAERRFLSELTLQPELLRLMEQLELESGASRNEANMAFQAFLNQHKHDIYKRFVVIDKSGRVVVSQDGRDYDQMSRASLFPERMKALIAGSPIFIPPVNAISADGDAIRAMLVAPMQLSGSSTQLALAMEFNPYDAFSDLLAHMRVLETSDVYLIDRDGRILTQPRFVTASALRDDSKREDDADFSGFARDPGGDVAAGFVPDLSEERWPLTRLAAQVIGIPASSSKAVNHPTSVLLLTPYRDYRGVNVVGTGGWDAELGLGLLSEVDAENAFGELRAQRLKLYSIAGLAIALLSGGIFFAWSVGHRAATVMRRSQEELQDLVNERTDRLQAILNNAADGVVVFDANLVISDFSPKAEQIFGVSKLSVIGKRITSLVEEGREQLVKLDLKNNKTRVVRLQGRRANGDIFPLEVSVASGRTFHGRSFTALARDISGRAEREQQNATLIREQKLLLHELDMQKRGMDEHAIVSVTGADGVIRYVNDKFVETFGYSAAELIGRTHSTIKSNKHSQAFYREMWQTIVRGDVWHGQFCNRSKSGELFWLQSTIVPFFDTNGKIDRYVSMRTDVSKQKLAQRELKESQDRFERLVDDIGDEFVIFSHDLEGRLQFVSEGIQTVFGLHKADVMNQFWQTVVQWCEGQAEHAESFQAKLLSGEEASNSFEVSFIHPNGEERQIQVVQRLVLNRDGEAQSIDGIVQDVTQRNRDAQEMRAARQAAESATQAKSEFLANMSHEIRTPMNAIIGLTDLCLRNTAVSAQQRDYLEKVYSASTSLLQILNDILDFSKIEAGKLDIETRGFSLDEVFNDLGTVIAHAAHDKGLEFLFFRDPNVPDNLVGDANRLRQILLNLANNAVKFTNHGEVAVAVRSLLAKPGEVRLEFSVRDTGIGMSKGQTEKLFLPFSQADSSITRKYGGTGLGLSISQHLLKLMDSEIRVESESGKGSCFSFTVTVPVKSATEVDTGASVLKDKRALVVDDCATSRQILESYLTYGGMSVVCAVSGLDGLNAIQQDPDGFDFVVADSCLGDMRGAALREAMSFGLEHQPHFILLSSTSDRESFKACSGVDLSGVLIKPLLAPALLEACIARVQGAPRIEGPTKSLANSPPTRPFQSARLLLVEDNELNQQVARELLEEVGFWVDVATNGFQAIQKFGMNRYDLVLMDIQMPVMGGMEATQKIREREDGRLTPIIAMTANVMQADIDHVLEAGMNDHIPKPIERSVMLETLLRWLPASGSAGTLRVNSADNVNNDALMPEIDGINVGVGLARLGGQVSLYRDILLKFVNNQSDAQQVLEKALSDKDFEAARRVVHTLKGIAGTIAAPELADAASELELSLAADGALPAPELIGLLGSELNRVINAINSIDLTAGVSGSATQMDMPEHLAQSMQKLTILLEGYDAETEDVLASIERQLPDGSLRADLQAVKRLTQNYDFDQALQVLQTLCQAHNIELDTETT